jgi:hypothetical protein
MREQVTSGERPFVDRSRRLTILGVLAILIGAACALLGVLALALALVTRALPAGGPAPMDPRMALIQLLFQALLAATFTLCGVGSIRARRWVRPVMLIVSWTWLPTGILMVGVMAVFLPDLLAAAPSSGAPLPPGVRAVVTFLVLGFSGLLSVVLPAIFCWGYQSRDVRLTCEARNPAPSWTDRCPMSVLAWSLGLGVCAVSAIPAAFFQVLPLFGRFLTGWPASALMLLVGLATAYLARATFRLEPAGWWGSAVLLVVGQASGIVTFLRHDLIEIYRRMGVAPEQLAVFSQVPWMSGRILVWWGGFLALAGFGYLLYIRRHFTPSEGGKKTPFLEHGGA